MGAGIRQVKRMHPGQTWCLLGYSPVLTDWAGVVAVGMEGVWWWHQVGAAFPLRLFPTGQPRGGKAGKGGAPPNRPARNTAFSTFSAFRHPQFEKCRCHTGKHRIATAFSTFSALHRPRFEICHSMENISACLALDIAPPFPPLPA